MTDSSLQRLNMVESQVRPSDVTDRRIIRAMQDVPREAFVAPALAPLAYMDQAVPLAAAGNGGDRRYLLAPRAFAKLVQAAEIGDAATVLDVGCASGYSTAVLAKIAASVVGLESDAALAATARRMLDTLRLPNAEIVEGALAEGAPAAAPFDAIVLNGAVPAVPRALLEQLAEDGSLVAIVNDGPLCRARVWRRSGTAFASRAAFEAGAEPLPGFAAPTGFVF